MMGLLKIVCPNKVIIMVFSCLCLSAVKAQKVSPQQSAYTRTVYFDTDKWELGSKQIETLTAFTDSIKAIHGVENFEVKITGYTDSVGTSTYNMQLSEKRATEVSTFLQQSGINTGKIETAFKGESNPRSVNKLAVNRRVEIALGRKTKTADLANETGSDHIRDLYKQTIVPSQIFIINTRRDTILRGKNNTIVYIPANTFVGDDQAEFILKEVYTFSDMILENLSTMSNGQMLETGGMVYANAMGVKSKETLDAKKEMMFMVPTDTVRPDMQLFFANRAHQEDHLNWLPAAGGQNNFQGFNPSSCGTVMSNDLKIEPCARCKFGCRLKRFGKPFQGMFNAETRTDNRALRQCQRNYRKARKNKPAKIPAGTPGPASILAPCDVWNSFYTPEQQKEIIEKIERGDFSSMHDLSFYTFRTKRLGWINCDAFANIPEDQKTTMTLDLQWARNIDCKLVFKKRRSIMAANMLAAGKIMFANIPKGEEAVLIVLKIQDGEPYLFIRDIRVQEYTGDVEPVKVDIKTLKEKLKMLDL